MNGARCVLIACVVGLLLSALGAAQELDIYNGSFEELDAETCLPAGWKPWNATRSRAAYTLGAATDGVAAALISDDNATDSQGLRSRPVKIEAGKTYEASVQVKIESLQAGGFACYLEFWDGSKRVLDKAASTERVGEWVELKVSGTAPTEATEATVLIYASSATVGVAYFDEVALRLVP